MGANPRIGVSACVLGEPVRYNGGHCRDRDILPQLAPHVEFLAVCPEVGAGLGAPRESLRLVGAPAAPRLVGGHSGRDETSRLTLWSRERARSLADMALDGFVLKKGSPSCGMERVRVYRRPDSRPSQDGVGIFARELMGRCPALAVEEDGRLHDPALREHFVTRVFASHRWRGFAASGPTGEDLASFHARHELLLFAHDAERTRALGHLATRVGRLDEERLHEYGAAFLRALRERPTHTSQARVMARILREIRGVTAAERADLVAAVAEYERGLVPLAVPARLLLHHARRESEWAATQAWFAPWPADLRLRTQVSA